MASDQCYYLSHHAVFIESSTSTKLRVVFDALAKTNTNFNLNDVLFKGPCVQEELVSLMARFRTHRYAITADIKKCRDKFGLLKVIATINVFCGEKIPTSL